MQDYFSLNATDNFYYQEIMGFTKRRISLQPIRTYVQRSTEKVVAKEKRAVTLKPKGAFTASPATLAADLLPVVKPAKPARQVQQEYLHPNLKPPRLSFDDRITSSKNRYPRLEPHQNSKKCIGLSRLELTQRKESHENTYYNLRKSRLVDITHENRRIYARINSQKSLYSSKEFDKSFQSNTSLSRRLSQSKLSKISSKHSIQPCRNSSKGSRKCLQSPKENELAFESQNIDKSQTEKVYRYMSIFCNRLNMKQNLAQKQAGKQSIPLKPIYDKYNKENALASQRSTLRKKEDHSSRLHRRNNLILTRLL